MKFLKIMLIAAMLFASVGATASEGVFKRKAVSTAKHKEHKTAAKKAKKSKVTKGPESTAKVETVPGTTYVCTFSEDDAQNIHKEQCLRQSGKGGDSADVLRRLGETCRSYYADTLAKDCKISIFTPDSFVDDQESGLTCYEAMKVTVLSGECPLNTAALDESSRVTDNRADLVSQDDFLYFVCDVAFNGGESPIEADARQAAEEAERQKNNWSERNSFIFVLPKDMTPKELVALLDSHKAQADQLEHGNCEEFDAQIQEQIKGLAVSKADRAKKPIPVLWYGLVYSKEVEQAREPRFMTEESRNPELAGSQLGTVKRWNPYMCVYKHGTEEDLENQPKPVRVGNWIVGPALPEKFQAGEGIWVIGNKVQWRRYQARNGLDGPIPSNGRSDLEGR